MRAYSFIHTAYNTGDCQYGALDMAEEAKPQHTTSTANALTPVSIQKLSSEHSGQSQDQYGAYSHTLANYGTFTSDSRR